MGKAKREAKVAERRTRELAKSITVEVVDKLPVVEDIRAVMVQTDMDEVKFLDPAFVEAIDAKIKDHYGDHVLVMILGKDEKVEQLDDRAMNLRGWVRLPGKGIHEH